MKKFIAYTKERVAVLAIVVFIFLFFAVSFCLYRLPLQAVIYPYLVCTALIFIAGVADFIKFNNRIRELELLKQNITVKSDPLAIFGTMQQQGYAEAINLLLEQRKRYEEDFHLSRNDMVQYYTLWVHQIKTPIASMRLTLQGEDSALSRRLSSELVRIERYVQMVMAYLRLNSPSTDYVFADHEVDGLLKQAIRNFSSEFIEKKIKLIYEPMSKKIVTDEKWFLFVLEQVILNSLKYTNKGYIKIYPKGEDTVCIEDSGIGIAPEDLPRIFENGYTGNIGRIDKHSSGLGLYLCKTVCDRINIDISATSTVGVGTKIYLKLTKM